MRICVLHRPTQREVDGIRLDVFEPGIQYEVGTRLGALFLAEGWAEPAAEICRPNDRSVQAQLPAPRQPYLATTRVAFGAAAS